jgi:hypothetical protein
MMNMTDRELDVDIIARILDLLEASEKLVKVLIGDRVVFGVGQVGRSLGDLGSLHILGVAGLVIWSDALAIRAASDEPASERRHNPGLRPEKNWGRRNAW